MARPRKSNADYFPHDAQLRNAPAVRAIRNKYGLAGYAVWCMLLEVVADAPHFNLELTPVEIEILAGDFGLDGEELEAMISYFQRLKLVKIEGEVLTIPSLVADLEPLLSKRKSYQRTQKTEPDTEKGAKGVLASQTGVSEGFCSVNPSLRSKNPPKAGVFDAQNPQSKVKYSKVKERLTIVNPARARKDDDDRPTFSQFCKGLTPPQLDELQAIIPAELNIKTEINSIAKKARGKRIESPAAYLRRALENLEVPRDIKKMHNERNNQNQPVAETGSGFGGIHAAFAEQQRINASILESLNAESALD